MIRDLVLGFAVGIFMVFLTLLFLLHPPTMFEPEPPPNKADVAFGELIGFEMVQPIFIGQDQFSGLELAIKNPSGREAVFRILGGDGVPIREIRAKERWDGYSVIAFPPIPDSRGKTYEFIVLIPTPGQRIRFFGSRAEDDPQSTLRINSVDTHCRLFYRPQYRPGYKELASILFRRLNIGKPPFLSSPWLVFYQATMCAALGLMLTCRRGGKLG